MLWAGSWEPSLDGVLSFSFWGRWAASRTQWKRPAPVKRWEDQVDLTLNQRTCWRCGAERVSVNKEDNPVLTYDCGTKVYIDMDIERIVNILGKDCHRKDTP